VAGHVKTQVFPDKYLEPEHDKQVDAVAPLQVAQVPSHGSQDPLLL
jgi:hypothetical protein